MEGEAAFHRGKETLIKVVAQAMPVFAMSVFKILKKIAKK